MSKWTTSTKTRRRWIYGLVYASVAALYVFGVTTFWMFTLMMCAYFCLMGLILKK